MAEGAENVVDHTADVALAVAAMGHEPPVEERAAEQVDGKFDVRLGGDLAPVAGAGQEQAKGLAAVFRQVCMQALQPGVTLGGIHEGREEPGEVLLVEQALKRGEKFHETAAEIAGCRQGDRPEAGVHGIHQELAR